MRFRPLGATGLQVSVVGIGTWQFGGEWGRDFSQAEVDAILDRGSELGINLIDTAECYGDHLSEKLIGDYLARRDRSRWIVATKFGHRFKGFMSRDDRFGAPEIVDQLEASLLALKTDHVDLYQFHSGSDAQFENDALWEALRRLKAGGKAKHLGISVLGKGSELQVRRAVDVGAEVLQVIYNRLDRRPEEFAFPHARAHGLGVLARVPLASGLLAGKIAEQASFGPRDFRATIDPVEWKRRCDAARDVLRTEVPDGVPPSAWAIAWCLRRPEVSAVIPGCKSPGQVEQNARAAGLQVDN